MHQRCNGSINEQADWSQLGDSWKNVGTSECTSCLPLVNNVLASFSLSRRAVSSATYSARWSCVTAENERCVYFNIMSKKQFSTSRAHETQHAKVRANHHDKTRMNVCVLKLTFHFLYNHAIAGADFPAFIAILGGIPSVYRQGNHARKQRETPE
jgi:hypothetical protein